MFTIFLWFQTKKKKGTAEINNISTAPIDGMDFGPMEEQIENQGPNNYSP